jgi:alcohol dehydrogenase (NADP+)
MLTLHGRLHSCGLPDAPLPEFQAQSLAGNGASLSVSHIGSKKQANEMLKLAVEKGVSGLLLSRACARH